MKPTKSLFSLIILLMITVPVIVHTRSLLLEITQVDAPRWVLEVYAIFFAVAFDCSIFMFALYKKREQAIVFAVISGIVGWLFWCSDLVFVDFPQAGSGYQETGKLWARLVMGTVWAGFSAYLVFWCSEIVAESFSLQSFVVKRPRAARRQVTAKPAVSTKKNGTGAEPHLAAGSKRLTALKLKSKGLTIAQIAQQLGVTDRSVRRYLA